MKVNGIDEENHKIFGEIERNRTFIKKIKEMENPDGESIGPGGDPQKKMKLDTAAAMRMVKPYMRQDKEPKVDSKSVVDVRKINKGSILPKREHLNWKEELERLQE